MDKYSSLNSNLQDKLDKSGGVLTGALYSKRNNLDSCPFFILPQLSYTSLTAGNADTANFLKETLKWICANYPNVSHGCWQGIINPNVYSIVILTIYNTDDISDGLPKYACGLYIDFSRISNPLMFFWCSNYTFNTSTI